MKWVSVRQDGRRERPLSVLGLAARVRWKPCGMMDAAAEPSLEGAEKVWGREGLDCGVMGVWCFGKGTR